MRSYFLRKNYPLFLTLKHLISPMQMNRVEKMFVAFMFPPFENKNEVDYWNSSKKVFEFVDGLAFSGSRWSKCIQRERHESTSRIQHIIGNVRKDNEIECPVNAVNLTIIFSPGTTWTNKYWINYLFGSIRYDFGLKSNFDPFEASLI